MSDTLKDICAAKREHIAKQKKAVPESALFENIKRVSPPLGFLQALQKKSSDGHIALIAEIKKASPSGGVIRADFDPAALARAYENAGAACLSVLTDIPYFQGDDRYLQHVCAASDLPVLRKDFMLDPYQVIESRALGADCILLIMAALTDAEAKTLYAAAAELRMDVLVEVHDAAELERALALNPALIGINNRNLKTLKTDLAVSETLAKNLPGHILAVCESGIRRHSDIQRLQKSGFSCFLVGESLMREADVEQATKTLLGTL
jgi:indole-3-glycerol phosphate synthase